MQHVLALAKAYTLVFAVVVVWLLSLPDPFFGPQPAWYERLLGPGAGLALLLIGWAWLHRIRKGAQS